MGNIPLRLSGWGESPAPFGIVGTKISIIMETTKSKKGGRREGAGRKPTGKKKITTTLTFSPDVLQFLRTKGRKQSEYVESLIRKDMMTYTITPTSEEEAQSLFYLIKAYTEDAIAMRPSLKESLNNIMSLSEELRK